MENKSLMKKDANGEEWKVMTEQASTMIKSGFLPQAIKTSAQAVAIAMTGKELGIGMMQSFRSINVIQGKPTLSANLMLALVQRSGLLENQQLKAEPNKQAPAKVIYRVKRKGMDWHEEEFGNSEAQAMGLLMKDNYKKQKFTMFKWRAVSNALRFAFGDLLHGIYTAEELGANVYVDDEGNEKIIDVPKQNLRRDVQEESEPKSTENETQEAKVVDKAKRTELADGLQVVNCFLTEGEERKSKKGTPFVWVTDHEGARYFTFSQRIILVVKRARSSGAQIELTYEKTEHGNKIVEAALVNEAEEEAPNEPN